MRAGFVFLLLVSLPAFAAGAWQRDGEVGVRLISAVDGVGQLAVVPLGLEIELAEGWHTYWRSPGMAGLPPQIEWQAGDAGNLQSVVLDYPAPKRYNAYGLETIGYRGHVVFPLEATLKQAGHALDLRGDLTLLVCSTVCVPKNIALNLTVPEGPATASAEAALIDRFRALVPPDAAHSALRVRDVTPDGKGLSVTVESDQPMIKPDLLIEDDAGVSFGAPQVALSDDRRRVLFHVAPVDGLPTDGALAGMKLRLTVIAGSDGGQEQALDAAVTVMPRVIPDLSPVWPAVPVPDHAPPLSLYVALLFALAGGFILNLMPCVLPVLSLKILSVVSHGGGSAKRVRRSFLTTVAGIVTSFLALAVMTIGLKELGLSLGWGVQFQQPLFLLGLIALLTLFAANMWGLFEIPLPQRLVDTLDTHTDHGPYRPHLAADFAAGAFATLLATPCSAPLLGTAVGFALAAGPAEIVAVFVALGCGMSLPYLAVALFPRFATGLPKPGFWMVRLRHWLGGALALTAVWLGWVLNAQIGARFAVPVGFMMLALVGVLALPRALPRRGRRLVVLALLAAALAATAAGSLMPKAVLSIDSQWQVFSDANLAANLAAGKTVFVDVTADWCLTCKANKKLVLAQPDIQAALFGGGIVAMQADWTNPDPAIGAFLHRYGRYGIPFNAVFSPRQPNGLILPELLTHDAVMKALTGDQPASSSESQ